MLPRLFEFVHYKTFVILQIEEAFYMILCNNQNVYI